MSRKLTEKQRDLFVTIVNEKDLSLRELGREFGISHMAIEYRFVLIAQKGYVEKAENGKYYPTSTGLEKFMNDKIHDRFVKTRR